MLTLERRRLPILLSGMLLLGCSNASAMAKKPIPQQNEPIPTLSPGPVEGPPSTSSDPYKEGLELGHRNGALIVQRLKDKTIGLQGCEALGELENALIKVSRSIKPPSVGGQTPDKQLGRGFYHGYLTEVKEAIRETRQGCNAVSFQDGLLPGELAGTVLCQISHISLDVLTEVEASPLYSGWSGGTPELVEQCQTSAQLVLKSCGTDLASIEETVQILIQLSCRD